MMNKWLKLLRFGSAYILMCIRVFVYFFPLEKGCYRKSSKIVYKSDLASITSCWCSQTDDISRRNPHVFRTVALQKKHVSKSILPTTVAKLFGMKSTFCDNWKCFSTLLIICVLRHFFVWVFALCFEFSLCLHTFVVSNKSYFPLKNRRLSFWILGFIVYHL